MQSHASVAVLLQVATLDVSAAGDGSSFVVVTVYRDNAQSVSEGTSDAQGCGEWVGVACVVHTKVARREMMAGAHRQIKQAGPRIASLSGVRKRTCERGTTVRELVLDILSEMLGPARPCKVNAADTSLQDSDTSLGGRIPCSDRILAP